MKTTRLSLIAALGLAASANGFTLDFIADVGATLPPDLVINVPGYGDVKFTAILGNLEVDTNFQTGGLPTPSLEFASGEIVGVEFLGAPVYNLSFDFIDLSPGESMNVNGSGNSYTVQLSGNVNGAGLQEITFLAVPETSTATLGLLGTALLAFRRRR